MQRQQSRCSGRNAMHRTERPLICHVEVGGTLGGSFLTLENYLRKCDPDRFRHEVIFYQRPPEVGITAGGNWPTISLGLPVPFSAAASSSRREGAARRSIRALVDDHPAAGNVISTARLGVRLIREQPQAWKFASFFRERGCALLHLNNHFTYQLLTLMAAERAGIPAISHYRTMWPVTWAEVWLSRFVECIAPQGEACADHLKGHSFKTPVKLLHDAIESPPEIEPDELARLRGSLLGDRAKTVVGTVTRLDEERKGIRDLLQAISILKEDWSAVKFVIVGDGSKAPDYKRTAQEMGIGDLVVFAGYANNPFLYYRCMDIFVCSSLVEGGPYTVLEAMQSGCAVVSTRVGQVPRWIRDGDDGLIVRPSDVHDLAAAIRRLLTDPAMRKDMGEKAALSIRQKLVNPEEGAAELDNLFQTVLQMGLSHGCAGNC